MTQEVDLLGRTQPNKLPLGGPVPGEAAPEHCEQTEEPPVGHSVEEVPNVSVRPWVRPLQAEFI